MSLQRNIRLLKWFNFFTDFKLYSVIAILYFAHVTHSYTLAAGIFSIAYITSAIFDVPTGIFSDQIGRKKTVFLGAAFAVLYSIFYAIGLNFWILAVGAMMEGLSRAFYSGNNEALLHNLLAEEGLEGEYHEYYGKLTAMFQVALGISGFLGALLANWSFPIIMWLSVLPQLACLVISTQLSETKKSTEPRQNVWIHLQEGIRVFLHNHRLRLLSVVTILGFGVGESTYQFQAAFYNSVLPIWAIGFVKVLSNLGAVLGFHYSGKVLRKFNAVKMLLMDAIYSRITNFIALLFPTVVSPFLMSSSSVFYGISSVAESTLLQKEFTDKQRATMSSLNSFMGTLFFGVFALATGMVADKLSPRTALLIAQCISLVTAGLTWKLLRLKNTPVTPA